MGLCEPAEYQRAFEQRVQFHQLKSGELYVARFEIEDFPKAYRILGRVGILAGTFGGVGNLEFQLLDDQDRPLEIPPRSTMRDGILNIDRGVAYSDPNRGALTMRDACLDAYSHGLDFDSWVAEMKELSGAGCR
jgi:hypothetical protein